MSMFFGFCPEPTTKQEIEQFENDALVRHNNQSLVGRVFVDMQKEMWAVAVAYNFTRRPGLHGHQNMLEVRYSYSRGKDNIVKMFRSDPFQETPLDAGSFSDPNVFVKYAIAKERMFMGV